jgi:hypothetical protein
MSEQLQRDINNSMDKRLDSIQRMQMAQNIAITIIALSTLSVNPYIITLVTKIIGI